MIPILFEAGETQFNNNGLGRLADAVRCEVTEERNGQYELQLDYPIDGPMFNELVPGRYIYATHDESKDPQPFEIYGFEHPLEGLVTVNAWHISYALNKIVAKPFSGTSCADALANIPAACLNPCPYTFWTDKSVSKDYETLVPKTVRSILGGEQGSILDVYGKGEYEFDKFEVKLYLNRGANRGVSIRYGKNLTSLDRQVDASDVANALAPFWINADEDDAVYYNGLVIKDGTAGDKAVPYDCSGIFEEKPTEAQLQAAAESHLASSTAYELKENLKIDFVQLWQTEEYKDVAPLQRIFLCDTVNIFYAKLGINATAKCIKVVYDALQERYSSMELGEPKTSLAKTIADSVEENILQEVPMKSTMAAAIENATKLITGTFGGHLVINTNADGEPEELLIMDSADKSTAVNVWRFNLGGLGHSHTGYNGPFSDVALTQDGKINATMIATGILDAARIAANSIAVSKLTGNIQNGDWEVNLTNGSFSTGELPVGDVTGNIVNGNWKIDFDAGTLTIGDITANNIKGGTLTLGGNNNVSGILKINNASGTQIGKWDKDGISMSTGSISDSSGLNSWNLTTGQFSTQHGTIGGFTIGSSDLTQGSIEPNVADGANIGPSGVTFATNNRKSNLYSGGVAFFTSDGSQWTQRGYIACAAGSGNTSLITIHAGSYYFGFSSDGNIYFNGANPVNARKLRSVSSNLITTQLSGTDTGAFSVDGYGAYIIVGYPSSSATARVSIIVAADAMAGNSWQISDEQHFYKFSIGSDGSLSGITGTGKITEVYGIN